MKKNLMTRLFALVMTLVMLSGVSLAEGTQETAENPGNLPERGLVFPMTEADVQELRLGVSFMVVGTPDVAELPIAIINFYNAEAAELLLNSYTEEDLQNEDKLNEALTVLFSSNHGLYLIALFEKDFYDAQTAAGKTAVDLLGAPEATVLGENDGYVYVGINQYDAVKTMMETETQQAALEKAIARCDELIAGMTFQPIVFGENEFTETPESAITFSTKDLDGNPVTEELFLGKKLTVLNVWGTYCTPCINEMPELAEWSQNMPEGVQLVGLVSDLNSYDNADMLETAKYICEATGANVYTHLVANETFMDLLSGVVGVPTTFFIDGTGNFVGEPVVSANVPACKAFVESYLAQ